jgi:general nucleoside transport system permease protein
MSALRRTDPRQLARAVAQKLGSATGVIIGALLIIYLLLALTSSEPLEATLSLIKGPLENPERVTQWLSDSANLTLTGLAVALVFRVGQFSLGAEGQLAMGALVAGALVLHLGSVPGAWAIGLLAGALGGLLWGLIPGFAKAYADADEIVSTLMLNYVALLFFSFAIKQWLMPADAGFPVSDFFAPHATMPTFGSSPAIPFALVIAGVMTLAVAYFLTRTRTGFEMRMTGSNLRFALNVGLRVRRSIWGSIALSGAIAGVAGAVVAESQTHRLILGLSGNIGYDGILVALLAANRPMLVPIAAIAYGYLRTGGDIAQVSSGIPRELVTTVQGILILFVTARFTGVGDRIRGWLRLPRRKRGGGVEDGSEETVSALGAGSA